MEHGNMKHKGQLLLSLLEAIASRLEGSYPKACEAMDNLYGDMWRREIKSAGLEHKLHENDTINSTEEFYADVARRLKALDHEKCNHKQMSKPESESQLILVIGEPK